MTYDEAKDLIDFLNERFRRAGMVPWYTWAVPITTEKLIRWARRLGYDRLNDDRDPA